jgi:hypothetical protein
MDEKAEIAAESPPVNKFLVHLVIWLGVALLLMFFALVAGIIYKAVQKRAAPPPGDVVVTLELPADKQFESAVLTGDKLTLKAGNVVYVVDVPTRRVLIRVQGRPD